MTATSTQPARRLLVGVGLPRCGTTWLFAQLERNRRSFCSAGKEKNYFLRHCYDETQITDLYGPTEPNKWTIDFSPSYSMNTPHAWKNLVTIPKGVETRIVLQLRHPLTQAFAHYLHDIKAHVSRLERGQDTRLPIFSPKSLSTYFFSRVPFYRLLVERFGRENILVVNFHSDLEHPRGLFERLAAFLELPPLDFDPTPIGTGGWLPYYVSGGNDGTEVVQDGAIKVVPPSALLLVNNQYSRFWDELSLPRLRAITAGQDSWTGCIDESTGRALMAARFDSELNIICELFGFDRSDFPLRLPLSAGTPQIGKEVFDMLPPRDTVTARLRDESP